MYNLKETPAIGRIEIINDSVRWTMTPQEARDLADVLEGDAIKPLDLAWHDIAALREAANLIDANDS